MFWAHQVRYELYIGQLARQPSTSRVAARTDSAGRPLQKENERLIIAPEHVVDKLSIIRDHLQDEEYAAAVVEN